MSIGFGLLAFAPFGERFLSIGILTGLLRRNFLGVVALLLGARTVTIYAPRSLIAFMIGSIAMQGFAKPPPGRSASSSHTTWPARCSPRSPSRALSR